MRTARCVFNGYLLVTETVKGSLLCDLFGEGRRARMWYSAQTVQFAQSNLKQKDSKHFEVRRYALMLWTILVVLLLLWLIGFYGGFVTSSLIHLLLVAAIVVLALNLVKQYRQTA